MAETINPAPRSASRTGPTTLLQMSHSSGLDRQFCTPKPSRQTGKNTTLVVSGPIAVNGMSQKPKAERLQALEGKLTIALNVYV